MAPRKNTPPAPEAVATEQAKMLVQAASLERAERNDEPTELVEQSIVARNALDEYLRRPHNLQSLSEQLKGSNIDPEWFARSLVTLVSSNDALNSARPKSSDMEASDAFHRSVLRCALNIAALRLDPSPYYGHAWVIPFKTRLPRRAGKGQMEVSLATLIIGYQGYVALGSRVGYEIDGDHIWAGQHFKYNRLRAADCEIGTLDRVPDAHEEPVQTWWSATNIRTGIQRVIFNPFGYYLRARQYSASYQQDLATEARINSGQWEGPFRPKSPWNTAPLPMVLKTAVRWNRKLLPLGDASAEEVTRWLWANRVDGGVFSPAGYENDRKPLWAPGQIGPLGVGDDIVDRDGEPEDGGTLIDVGTAEPPEPEFVPDSHYLANLRAWDGGADVAGIDMTEQVVAMIEAHGWDSNVVMPVLRGARLDPQIPRPLLIALHALCSTADAEDDAEAE